MTLPGTVSEIFLGRDGNEGHYVDIQEINRSNSRDVSRGTYAVELIPEPSTALLLASGLAALAVRRRRRTP